MCLWRKGTERFHFSYFNNGRTDCGWPLETGQIKEMNSLLEPLERKASVGAY